MQKTPHFVRDYRQFARDMLSKHARDTALSLSTGPGDYVTVGTAQLAILKAFGLEPRNHVVEVGCGIGRLAYAVAQVSPPMTYLGIDVVPEHLEYAREQCRGSHCHFAEATGTAIPASDSTADFVVFISVLTTSHASGEPRLSHRSEART